MKRLISLLLCISMLFGVLAVASFAEGEEWVFQGEYEVEPISDIIPDEEPSPSPETEIAENTEVPEETQTDTEIPAGTEEEPEEEAVIIPGEEENPTEQEPEDEDVPNEEGQIPGLLQDGAVTVYGNIPDGISLVVEDWSDVGFYSEADGQFPLAMLNITLLYPDGETEWQPQPGENVLVTLDMASLGLYDGSYIVSHLHEEEQDDMLYTTRTNFPCNSYGGSMSFYLPNFSYVLVFPNTSGTDHTISNVKEFYTVNLTATTSQFEVVGLYKDTNDKIHILVEATNGGGVNNLKNWTAKIDGNVDLSVYNNGTKTSYINFTQIVVKDSNNNVVQTVATRPGSAVVDFETPSSMVINPGMSFEVNGQGAGLNVTGTIAETKPKFNLSVTPTVSGASPSATDEFSYTFTFSDTTTAYNYTVNGVSKGTVKSGETIKLKAGEKAVITDIISGTSYSITESHPSNYQLSATPSNASGTLFIQGEDVQYLYTVPVVQNASLTITKTGSTDNDQTFIFKVTDGNGLVIPVMIEGNGSQTIRELTPGTYSVTEETVWSWRYTPGTATQTVTLAAGGSETVTFNNTRSNSKWLNGLNSKENKFAGVP